MSNALPDNSVSDQESPETSLAGAPRHAGPVTARAVILGLLGGVQVAAIQVSTKVRPTIIVPPFNGGPYLSWYAILPGAVFWLFLMAILNAALRRWRPRTVLQPAEFAVIFGMTTVAGAISAQDEVMQLLPMYMYPFRASQTQAMGAFRQYIPAWMIPHDPKIVEPYYLGSTNFWSPQTLAAWLLPLSAWMSYLTALGATMWAWNVILRRRWMDHDRLAFPNAQLPMQMCRAAGFGGMVSGKLFWSGLIVAALIESLSPLHQRYPDFPVLPVTVDISSTVGALSPPWNALAPMTLIWGTMHLGICYFIPLDILFSAGFFYLFRKGLEVFGRGMGWRDIGWDAAGFPYSRAQAAGAWAALFVMLVWAERHHLARVLKAAFTLSTGSHPRPQHVENDADEPGSYRWAGRILMGGTLFLILFSIAGGMSPAAAIVFYAFFWMLNVTMTRIYAQVGPPTLELYFLDPQTALTTAFGARVLPPGGAVHLALLYWLNRTSSGHPMAHQMTAFYIGKESGVRLRPMGRWVVVGFVAGALACLLAYLHYAYRAGEDQWSESGWRESGASGVADRLNQWIGSPKGPNWVQVAFMFVGASITFGLAKASFAMIGFPLHPVGFALAMCYGVEYTWPSFLFMWLFKFFTLRYGGRRHYELFVPFFLGLILGGLVTPVLWGIVAGAFHWYN